MAKYNNYKKYYQTHREQEIKRTRAYYDAHRDEILARSREKRKNQPKFVKLTANDYKFMWNNMMEYLKKDFPFWHMIMKKYQLDYLEKKEKLKDE